MDTIQDYPACPSCNKPQVAQQPGLVPTCSDCATFVMDESLIDFAIFQGTQPSQLGDPAQWYTEDPSLPSTSFQMPVDIPMPDLKPVIQQPIGAGSFEFLLAGAQFHPDQASSPEASSAIPPTRTTTASSSSASTPAPSQHGALDYSSAKSSAPKHSGVTGKHKRSGCYFAEASDLLRTPLRVDMTSSRTKTVDHLVTPDGLVTMVRLTRKNETTRNTALVCHTPVRPIHHAHVARIDLIENDVIVSFPQKQVDLPFQETRDGKDSAIYWAHLDSHFFNSSSKSANRLWQSQRRKTLFLFYCGSVWGIPVYITPRDTTQGQESDPKFVFSHFQDEGMRQLLSRFYSEISTRHPSEVLGDKNACKSLRSFALLGKSAYISVFIPFLQDKDEPDEQGLTALHIASRDGHLGCVYRLVQGGANVFAADLEGNLPLHYAAGEGHTEITLLLSSRHYSTLQTKNNRGQTASEVAAERRRNYLAALLHPGMYHGRASAKSRRGQPVGNESSFHQAVIDGNLDAVRNMLTDRRHHPNELDPAGNSAIYLACRHGRFDVLLCLLVELQQAAPQLRQICTRNHDTMTPLMAAAQEGHADCLLALLKFREKMPFDLNEVDKSGKTALHYACEAGRAMCTFILISNNANQLIADAHGNFAGHYARVNNHTMTTQIADSARQLLENTHSSDIQLFLESFGFVNRMDMFDTFCDISDRMSKSLKMATDELTSEDDFHTTATDHSLEDLDEPASDTLDQLSRQASVE